MECENIVLFLLSLFFSVSKGVRIDCTSSPVFEFGKAGIIECNITFATNESTKSTTLYFVDKKGEETKIGDNYVGVYTSSSKLLPSNKTSISITLERISIIINELQYEDDFHFICKAVGVSDIDLDRKTSAPLVIKNVKGGVDSCGIKVPKDYFLQEGTNTFEITLCGNPRPKLSYTFQGRTNIVKMVQKVDDSQKKYKYEITLVVHRNVCKSDLGFKATGFNNWQDNFTVQVKYKPSAIENLEAFKKDNCTFFKIPSESSTQCKHTYIVYTYDASKKLLQEFQSSKENEFNLCNSNKLLEKIEFAKAEVVWMNETSEPMTHFVYVGFKQEKSGPENCGTKIPKEYLLIEGTNAIEMTLCGNPKPKLSYTFRGKTNEAKMVQKLDHSKKMYKYKIALENVDKKDCGSRIQFNATGFKSWQSSSIIFVEYKPSAIEGFEAFKGDNCTLFKIPSQSSTTTHCKHTYNVYTYDASKNLLQESLNISESETMICDNKTTFDRIKFIKAEAVWMKETGFEMEDFVAVEVKNTSRIENGGPASCEKEIQKEFLLREGSNRIEMTLCGNPQPKLSYTFKGKTKDAKMIEKLDDSKKMYKYEIILEYVDRNVCGSTIQFNVTGSKNWRATSTVIVKYKPKAVKMFEAFKERNCTIMRISSQNTTKCRPTFNIFFYDASKKVVEQILDQSAREVKVCNNLTIGFAKVIGVWLGETGEEMDDFVAVTPKSSVKLRNTTISTTDNKTISVGNEQTEFEDWTGNNKTVIITIVIIALLVLIMLADVVYSCVRRKRTTRKLVMV